VKMRHELFIYLAKRKLPNCVCTSQQTASFFNAKIVNMRPVLFLQNLQTKNFQNASEIQEKQLCFGCKSCDLTSQGDNYRNASELRRK